MLLKSRLCIRVLNRWRLAADLCLLGNPVFTFVLLPRQKLTKVKLLNLGIFVQCLHQLKWLKLICQHSRYLHYLRHEIDWREILKPCSLQEGKWWLSWPLLSISSFKSHHVHRRWPHSIILRGKIRRLIIRGVRVVICEETWILWICSILPGGKIPRTLLHNEGSKFV